MTMRRINYSEASAIRTMIRKLGLQLSGRPRKRERPDFALRLTSGLTVGVEIVRAMNEHIARGRGTVERVARLVRDGLATSRLTAEVMFSMSEENAALLHDQATQLRDDARRVVAVAATVLSDPKRYPNGQNFRRQIYQHDDGNVLPTAGVGVTHLEHVSVRPHPEAVVHWGMSANRLDDPSLVQSAIDAKASNLDTYRRGGFDEQWLLTVGNAGIGCHLAFQTVAAEVFKSPFDRTLLLDLFDDECALLNTAA